MPIAAGPAILIGMGVTGGVTGYFGSKNVEEQRRQRNAQQNLEEQRRQQLTAEAAAQEAAKAQAATAGQRVGRRTALVGALGFGSGSTTQGLGSGTLFGN